MSAEDAFDFSSVVGSNYLINDNGISMKGRNEVFIHRSLFHNNSLIYSPGLYGRDVNLELQDENSGCLLKNKFPSIFKGQKKIIFIELKENERSNIENKIIKIILDNKLNPEDYILFKHRDLYKNLEPFLEWITFKFFEKKGYIFENQCPFFQQSFQYKNKSLTGGIPDISAFKLSSFQILYKYNILNEKKGILINKLPNLINFNLIKKIEKKPTTLKYELILGEAKTDVSYLNQAINQLTKYSKVELANRLYTIIPNCKNNNNNYFGEGFISKEKFYINESINKINVNKDNQKVDEDWLNNSIKLNLLGNLPFEELKRLIKKRHKMNKDSKIYSSHLLNYAVNLSVEEIMEIIINYHGIH